ncbi:hypothetical protein AX15_006742 [Amanita polypyramis BW_CC]|nr:hypothetical protein AX15_006742 [Amanita polypyramis BW_CC]
MSASAGRLQNLRFPKLPSIDFSKFRKKALGAIRIRSLYAKLTLSPFTLIYFLLAFLTCVVMVALQAVIFADNASAVNTISPIIARANVSHGLTLSANGILNYCDRISQANAAQCTPIVPQPVDADSEGGFILTWRRDLRVPRVDEESRPIGGRGTRYNGRRYIHSGKGAAYMRYKARSVRKNSRSRQIVFPMEQPSPASVEGQQVACAKGLLWLKASLNDESREDIVTLIFQFWLLSLATVAILNESLPHLGAALAGHILGTAWAGYRVRSSYRMLDIYQSQVVSGVCGGFNPLRSWWQIKIAHTIPIVVSDAIALAFMLFLSYKIYKVYSSRTLSLVGATPEVERILKIFLLFSVSLHLTMFFVIASNVMWINKAINGTIINFLKMDGKGFLAASAITLILILPWTVTGYISVRRECQWRFLIFCIMSILLLMIFTMMFWSGLYRFIFTSWPFFMTITVTAYTWVVLSTIFAIWCRFNFGQGFAHFIQVREVLENMDFPSLNFSKEGIAENGMRNSLDQQLHIPPVPTNVPRNAKFMRASVYSNNNVATVKLSSSQPLYSEMVNTTVSPTSTSFRRAPSTISVTQRLRRVFEYRRSNTTTNTSGSAETTTTTTTTVAAAPAAPIPESPKPILTSQIAQQARSQPSRPPPLEIREEDDNTYAERGRKTTDRAKRRSRSASLGRSLHSTTPMETIKESIVLDLPPRPKTSRRPLPIRPLPRPPASAPVGSNTSKSHAGASLARKGGMREAGRSDTRPFEQQW